MKAKLCIGVTYLYLALAALLLNPGCNYNYEKKPGKTGGAHRSAPGPGSSQGDSNQKLGVEQNLNGVYARIIATKCLTCHRTENAQGGAAFESAEDLRRWSERIRFRALTKRDMPPQNQLSPGEIPALGKWLDEGAPLELGDSSEDWSVSPVPSFNEIKLRVFAKSCFQCHSGINSDAGLDLENIEAVKAARETILKVTLIEKTMPLPPFDELSAKQKKLLSNWYVEGMPE